MSLNFTVFLMKKENIMIIKTGRKKKNNMESKAGNLH